MHYDMFLLRFHAYVGDSDALNDDMLCFALFLLLIFNAYMFLPWFDIRVAALNMI